MAIGGDRTMSESWKDVYDTSSPIHCAFDRLADKWTLLILGRLFEGSAHFGELHRSIGGISKKVLTDYLRRLERDGFLVRRPSEEPPTTVEYSLTPFGESTKEPIATIRAWADRNHDAIRANWGSFDSLNADDRPGSA